MLCHIKDLVNEAMKGGYAVGAFNVQTFETALGIAQAAVRADSPAIMQVSEGAIDYMGIKPITHIMSTVAKNVAASVPIALHLDHGKSVDSVFQCIDAGFSSVHIDASEYPLDENISITKKVVEMAYDKNVWVQGEIGVITGGHGDTGGVLKDIPIARLEDILEFVRQTGVDTISAAIGTAHGAYQNETIVMELLKKIKEKVKIPFVLHGGSGLPDDLVCAGIREGINIINIGTDVKVAFTSTLKATCLKMPDETDPRKILKPTIKAVEEVVAAKMALFGSAHQSRLTMIK